MIAIALICWAVLIGGLAAGLAYVATASWLVVASAYLLVGGAAFLLGAVLVWGVSELWYRQTGGF